MEMIDVLKKLQEIADRSPEIEKAVQSVKATNPVSEGPIGGMAGAGIGAAVGGPVGAAVGALAGDKITGSQHKKDKKMIKKDETMTQGEKDKAEKYVKGMKKDKSGFEKRYGDEAKAVMYATANKMAQKEDETNERVGGMSDIHIGAGEVVGEYTDEDGNLKMPKDQVIRAMEMEKAKAPFPRSYEIETAIKMVQDDFDDSGEPKPDMEPAMDAEQPADEGNAFAQAVQKAKAAGMKKGDKFKVGDEEHTLRDSDFEEVNTNTMENKDKEVVKEAIQVTADTPEEAGMFMQILKLAGVKPVDSSMIGAEEPEHGSEMDPGELNKKMDVPGDDAIGSMQMAKMRDMMTKPDEEKQEETFANEPEEKVSDIDTLVNVHSGGANKQKQQVKKEYPGDNPLAVKEDTITEEELANSLRTQYETFKQSYQEAAKPDYIDLDKDGNKTEPMKKAAKDKEEKSNK